MGRQELITDGYGRVRQVLEKALDELAPTPAHGWGAPGQCHERLPATR